MNKTNKIKNVILHIGFPKTATTSIQKTLFGNDKAAQYCYPRSWSRNHGPVLLQMFINESYGDIFSFLYTAHNLDANVSQKTKDRHKAKLIHDIRLASAETLILSAEILSAFPEQALLELKSFLFTVCQSEQINISVVAYVRNPISIITSLFQQLVHSAYYLSMTGIERVSEINARHDMGLSNFIHVFGKENVKLFKFEDALLHPYGPVGFFYETCLAFELSEIEQLVIQKSNERCSQIAIDICLYMNEHVPMFHGWRLSGDRILGDLKLLAGNISGVGFQLPKEILYSHLDKCKQQLEYLLTTFNIEYVSNKIKYDIENDTTISHVPTIKNLEEIDAIFYQLNRIIQVTLIKYLQEIKSTLTDNPSLSQHLGDLICKLEKKEKDWLNKVMKIGMKLKRRGKRNALIFD